MTNRGGLFWGRITERNIPKLQTWSDVVLNDSQINGPENEITDPVDRILKCDTPPRVWFSINALSVFVDSRGRPSVYWPMQRRLHEVANLHNSWLHEGDGRPVEESAPWGRVRFLDMGYAETGRALAYEMAHAASDPQIHGLFLDEAHSTIADIRARHPGINVNDYYWREGLRWILRQYAVLMGGRPKPVITNGTFGRNDSALVSGRFWQAVRSTDLPRLIADADGATRTMLHGCGDMVTPLELSEAAKQIGSACWQWTPTNGPFVYDWIPEPVAGDAAGDVADG